MKILIVDDHEINRSVLTLILRKLGFYSDTANNGLEAIKAVHSMTYHLVFMDLEMPEMDGLATTKWILSSINEPPAIIAVTSNYSSHTRSQCHQLGMIHYIEKPVSLQKIRDILTNLQLTQLNQPSLQMYRNENTSLEDLGM